MENIDSVPSNVQFSHQKTLFFIVFEDNETMIKIIFKEKNPTMRNVSKTHTDVLVFFLNIFNLNPKI